LFRGRTTTTSRTAVVLLVLLARATLHFDVSLALRRSRYEIHAADLLLLLAAAGSHRGGVGGSGGALGSLPADSTLNVNAMHLHSTAAVGTAATTTHKVASGRCRLMLWTHIGSADLLRTARVRDLLFLRHRRVFFLMAGHIVATVTAIGIAAVVDVSGSCAVATGRAMACELADGYDARTLLLA
jgi:hypothetical protein